MTVHWVESGSKKKTGVSTIIGLEFTVSFPCNIKDRVKMLRGRSWKKNKEEIETRVNPILLYEYRPKR